jgi:hypothetical protein
MKTQPTITYNQTPLVAMENGHLHLPPKVTLIELIGQLKSCNRYEVTKLLIWEKKQLLIFQGIEVRMYQ